MTDNGPEPAGRRPNPPPALPPPVGQKPVPGGLIGSAGVNVTSTVYGCGASSGGFGELLAIMIFLLIMLLGRM